VTEEAREDRILAHSLKVGNVKIHQQLRDSLLDIVIKLEACKLWVQVEHVVGRVPLLGEVLARLGGREPPLGNVGLSLLCISDERRA